MSTQAETYVVGRILKALRERGYYVEKIHGSEFQAAGIPDLIGFAPGFGFGIEVKDPKRSGYSRSEREAIASLTSLGIPTGSAGGCSKLQALHIRRIIRAGGKAGVATSVEEALAVVEG